MRALGGGNGRLEPSSVDGHGRGGVERVPRKRRGVVVGQHHDIWRRKVPRHGGLVDPRRVRKIKGAHEVVVARLVEGLEIVAELFIVAEFGRGGGGRVVEEVEVEVGGCRRLMSSSCRIAGQHDVVETDGGD